MAIVVLLVVVMGAMVLVHLLQNRQDMRGMADHHRAMEALHKVADVPNEGASIRPAPGPGLGPRPVRPLMHPTNSTRRPHRGPRRGPRRGPVATGWRRPALVAALVLLVATGVAGVTKLSTGSGHRSPAAVKAAKPPATPARTPTTKAPTPTTAPPDTTLQPASEQTTALEPAKADASTADYVIGNAPFSVVVTAGGPCWLQVRTAAGQVLFSGTLAPGQIQTFSGTDLRLRLGAAGNVTLQVNGSSLVVPVRTPDPYNVRVAQTA